MDNLLEKRQELETRKAELGGLKVPIITAQMRHTVGTRVQRQRIRQHRREIVKQKRSYVQQIKAIDEYLLKPEDSFLEPPKTTIFNTPKLVKTRAFKGKKAKLKRARWL